MNTKERYVAWLNEKINKDMALKEHYIDEEYEIIEGDISDEEYNNVINDLSNLKLKVSIVNE